MVNVAVSRRALTEVCQQDGLLEACMDSVLFKESQGFNAVFRRPQMCLFLRERNDLGMRKLNQMGVVFVKASVAFRKEIMPIGRQKQNALQEIRPVNLGVLTNLLGILGAVQQTVHNLLNGVHKNSSSKKITSSR